MNNKILIKNIMLFVFPLLIPVVILGSFAIIITDKYMRESIHSNNMNVLLQLEQQTNAVLNEMYLLNLDYNWNPDIIRSLQNIFDSESLSYEELRDSSFQEGNIRRKEIATPYIQSIYIYYNNTNQRVLTSRLGFIDIHRMNDTTWLDEYKPNSQNEEIWMKNREIIDYSNTTKEPVISVFHNIFKSNSPRSEGLIVLNIYQKYFQDLITELNNYHHQSIFVLDENNNKLYGNANSDKIDLEQLALSNTKSTYEITIDDTDYVVHQLVSEPYDLRFFSFVNKKEIYLIPNQLRLGTLLFVVLSLLLGTATIYYLSRKNARHVSTIISILNTTNQSEGDLNKHISLKDNEYQLIVQKILKNYVANNLLEKELREKKYQLQAAELLALQNQINPHFLSNTLTIIYWRAIALTGKPNKVTKMLEILTDILNFSLRIKHHTVTLKEEVHHTKNYLEIFQIRSDQPFHVIWDDEGIDPNEQVLKFILQPLIENSITHGSEAENQLKDLQIKIRIRKKRDRIRIVVVDNGVGMSKKKLKNLLRSVHEDNYSTNHIGLSNINKRLNLLFNQNYQFIIRSKTGWGTLVMIEHPIQQNAPKLLDQ